jgi:hypothetical protein
MKYETRTLKMGVCVKGEAIFHESMTEIEIVDEAGGEFLKIIQWPENDDVQEILIDQYEWPTLRAAIDKMMKECRAERKSDQ